MTTRAYWGVVLGVALLILVGGQLTHGQANLERELVVVTTGGAFEKALKENFYDAFSKATGVVVRPVSATVAEAWAKARAMYDAGSVEWDILSASPADLIARRDILLRLDCRAIPNAATLGIPGTCQEHGLLRTIGADMIAYNTQKFPTGRHPHTWAEFWDVQKFPGPRSMPTAGNAWEPLAAALLADGVPSDKLFPMDLDRAFRKMDQIKPHVRVWWRTGDQSQQIIRDGEVVLAMMWSGRAFSLKNAGVPVGVEWNQGIENIAYWAVLRAAPHPKAVYAFLNFFMTRPEAHRAFSREIVAALAAV